MKYLIMCIVILVSVKNNYAQFVIPPEPIISPDGSFVGLKDSKGLLLRSTSTDWKMEILTKDIKEASFFRNNRKLLYAVNDSIIICSLPSGDRKYITGVVQYAYPKPHPDRWIA